MGKNYGKKLLNYKKYCYMYFLRSKVKILEMYRHCMNKVQKKIKGNEKTYWWRMRHILVNFVSKIILPIKLYLSQ
jgi:hypothetical protein